MTRKTSSYSRKRSSDHSVRYDILSELVASPTKPMPEERRRHQLTRMWGGIASIETSPNPTKDDWRVCSDAVNLMETLIKHNDGHWLDCDGDVVHISDSSCLLQDASDSMAMAGKRSVAGGNIRLDAKGIHAVRAVLEDYARMLETLPERTMIKVHRITEKRILEIMSGKLQSHDVEIVDI